MNLNLTEKTIINTVMDYIEENIYNYVVMIDGDWGSGKTYFIKKKLIPKINVKYKDKKIIYISLYGISLLPEIDKQLYMSKYIDGDEKTFNVASFAMSLGFDYLKSKGIKLNEKNIRKMFGNLLSIGSNSILIFDDLERCKVPINDLLGYINQFVEHHNLKVIIVANEKEINKTVDKNVELKYLIASLNHIDTTAKRFNPFLQHTNTSQKSKDTNEVINVETLKERANIIFSSKSEYDSIKEKIIGLTISYQPNIKECLNTIIEENSDDKLREKLKSHLDDFYNLMVRMQHINFRTYQFYLLKISCIYNKIINLDLSNEYLMIRDEFIDVLIMYVFEQCILLKKDGFLHFDKNNEVITHENVYDENYNIISSYNISFVKIYLQFSWFDEDLIKKSIDLYYIKYSSLANEKYKILKNAESWYVYEEADVIKIFLELEKYLDSNEYSINDYDNIIMIVIKVKYWAGLDYIDKFVDIMKNNISKSHEYLTNIKAMQGHFLEEKDRKLKDEYSKIVHELNEAIKKQNKQLNYDIVSTIFQNPSWCTYLLDEDTRLINGTLIKAPIDIFSDINIQELMKHLYKQTISEIRNFRTYISLWKEPYKKQINQYGFKIQECIDYIEKHMHEDRIKYMHLKYLKKDSERILSAIPQIEDSKK